MVLTVDRKKLTYYGLSVICIVLSLIFILSTDTRVAAGAAGSCTNASPNTKVGYNLGAYGCDDWEHQNATLKWAAENGDWIMVMMGRDCKQVNSGIPIDYIVANAGGNVIVRLTPGSSGIPVSEADQAALINDFAACLQGLSKSVYVEPHNEVNWTIEAVALNNAGGITQMAQGTGSYLRNLTPKLQSLGHKVLFPSLNVYQNSELADPASFVTAMNIGGLNFDGVSVHMYYNAGGVYYASGDPCRTDISLCADAVINANTRGVNYNGQVFITEMGIQGTYGDPATAQFLGMAWEKLKNKGNVVAALPFIYNPDLSPQAQCNEYYLPSQGSSSSVGSSAMVSAISYKGCSVDWDSMFDGVSNSTDLANKLGGVLGCPSGRYVTCGTNLCSTFWTCCNGFPTYGIDSQACLWPEWGDEVRPCTGEPPVVDKMVCTEGMSLVGQVSSNLASWFSGEQEYGRFGCNCTIRLSTMLYPTGISTPYGIVIEEGGVQGAASFKPRTGDMGGLLDAMSYPGANGAAFENTAPASTPTIVEVTTSATADTVSEFAVEDAQTAWDKLKTNTDLFCMPGECDDGMLDLDEYLVQQMEGVCKNEVNSVLVEGLEYCSVQGSPLNVGAAGDWIVETVIDRTISVFNPCQVSVKNVQFYVTDTFGDLMLQYDEMLSRMSNFPGGETECDDVGEMYVEVGAYICGKYYDNLKLYFPGVLKLACLMGESYDQLTGMPGANTSEEFTRLQEKTLPEDN